MREQAMRNKKRLYKKKYMIVFYDMEDETYLYGFNNCYEICVWKKWEPTPKNLNFIQYTLCRALKRETHKTNLLDGTYMRVYLVDINEDL